MPHSALVPLLVAGAFGAGLLVGRDRPAVARPVPPAARAADPAARVFELRTYTAPPGKLPALHARFARHTLALFARHGMTNVGYWTPQDSARRGTTIVYLLAHPSRQAARASWAAFGADPEWQRVRAASEADGPIVERVESVFLDPTDFSPMR